METPTQPATVSNRPVNPPAATQDSADLLAKARGDAAAVLKELGSEPDGLSEAEAATRLQQVGTNEQNSVFDLKRANESSKLNSLKRRQIDRLPAPCGFVPPGSTELALRA